MGLEDLEILLCVFLNDSLVGVFVDLLDLNKEKKEIVSGGEQSH